MAFSPGPGGASDVGALRQERDKVEQTLRDIEQVRTLEYHRMKETLHTELAELKQLEDKVRNQGLQIVQQRQEKLSKDQMKPALEKSSILTFTSKVKELEAQIQKYKSDRQKLIDELEKVKQERNSVVAELSQLKAEFYRSKKEKDEMLAELENIKRSVVNRMA